MRGVGHRVHALTARVSCDETRAADDAYGPPGMRVPSHWREVEVALGAEERTTPGRNHVART